MYYFHDDNRESKTDEKASRFKSNDHLNRRITNCHLENCITSPQMPRGRRSPCEVSENAQKLKTILSIPEIIYTTDKDFQMSLEDIKISSDEEVSLSSDHLTGNGLMSQLGNLDIVMEDTIKMDFREVCSGDRGHGSISFGWPGKNPVGKVNLPSSPAISRRHSVSAVFSKESIDTLRPSVTPTLDLPKYRPQRRRSVVWADETKTNSLETVHFISKRSASFDQINVLVNWFKGKCSNK